MRPPFGKLTAVPTSIASTWGMNSCFHWSIVAVPAARAAGTPVPGAT